jgi:hypothetical protein
MTITVGLASGVVVGVAVALADDVAVLVGVGVGVFAVAGLNGPPLTVTALVCP